MAVIHLRTVVEIWPKETCTKLPEMVSSWRAAGWEVESVCVEANMIGLVALRRQGQAEAIEAERDRNLSGEVAGHHRGARAVLTWRDGEEAPETRLADMISRADDRLTPMVRSVAESLKTVAEVLRRWDADRHVVTELVTTEDVAPARRGFWSRLFGG